MSERGGRRKAELVGNRLLTQRRMGRAQTGNGGNRGATLQAAEAGALDRQRPFDRVPLDLELAREFIEGRARRRREPPDDTRRSYPTGVRSRSGPGGGGREREREQAAGRSARGRLRFRREPGNHILPRNLAS